MVLVDQDRIALAGDQYRRVARRALEQRRDLAERHALADQAAAAVDQDQLDRLALGDVDQISARRARRQGHAARGESLSGQARPPPR